MNFNNIKIGDTVLVQIEGREIPGVVAMLSTDPAQEIVAVDLESGYGQKHIWAADLTAPTPLPDWAVDWCHYCGQPAAAFNILDVPECTACAG